MPEKIVTGLQHLVNSNFRDIMGVPIALLCHTPSVDSHFRHIVPLMLEAGVDLRKIFAPEHGIFGTAQDQIAVGNEFFPQTNIPVISLYGASAQSLTPSPEYFDDVELVVIDIMDIGTRYYTFVWTAALIMRVAAKCDVPVLILDRPNPLNCNMIEGCVQHMDFRSFVGLYPCAVRHGMTVGELLQYVNEEFSLGCELNILKCNNLRREQMWCDMQLDWILPSPNMPSFETALVYPGMCLLEATNISEGRGTTRPFEIFGAPFCDAHKLLEHIEKFELNGVAFRWHEFVPTFNKFATQRCFGAQLHVTDKDTFEPFLTALAIIAALITSSNKSFLFKKPPYEYETINMPFDILTGSPILREMLGKNAPFDEIRGASKIGLDDFYKIKQRYEIY